MVSNVHTRIYYNMRIGILTTCGVCASYGFIIAR